MPTMLSNIQESHKTEELKVPGMGENTQCDPSAGRSGQAERRCREGKQDSVCLWSGRGGVPDA